MCSSVVVVTNVVSDDSSQMSLSENIRVIQALSTNRSYDTLNVRILPGWACCDDGIGLDDMQSTSPIRPEPGGKDPELTVCWRNGQLRMGLLHDN